MFPPDETLHLVGGPNQQYYCSLIITIAHQKKMYLSGCMNTHTLLPFPLAYALSNTHNHRFPPCFFFYSFILSFVLKYFQMYIEVENTFTQRLHPRFTISMFFIAKGSSPGTRFAFSSYVI